MTMRSGLDIGMRMTLAASLAVAGLLSVAHVAKVRAEARMSSPGMANDMGGHMAMTSLRPVEPGDQARADAVLAAARTMAARYTDYRKALADGYKIFLPEAPQHVYHFTQDSAAMAAQFRFDASRPTSLLYEKGKGGKGYKLVGVMYTDRYGAPEDELNQRVPLSVAQWHVHTNLCLPPRGEAVDWTAADAKFGLKGSITTQAACRAAGGRFMPHLFGWMVHVYPFETDAAKIWGSGMDDDDGMQHDAMPGMKMGAGEKM